MSLPGEIVQGILARAALAILRVYLGVAFLLSALPKFERDPELTKISDLFTVEMITRYIEGKLNGN